MKLISQESDRIRKLLEENEELKKENALLRNEIARLQVSGVVVTKPIQTSHSTTTKRYTRPTKASRDKENRTPQKDDMQQLKKESQSYCVGGDNYRYRDGALIPTDLTEKSCKKYSTIVGWLNPTKSSGNRKDKTDAETLQRKATREKISEARVKPHPLPKDESTWGNFSDGDQYTPVIYDANDWGLNGYAPRFGFKTLEDVIGKEEDVPEAIVDDESAQETTEQETQQQETSRLPERELAKRSGYDNDMNFIQQPANIESKLGFMLLRRAMTLVQEAVYEVGKTGALSWRPCEDGPHLVRLGREEQKEWAGYYLKGYNGFSSSDILRVLDGVVELRNKVSHPRGPELRIAGNVQELLKCAQAVTITLGDVERTMELKCLRDTLRKAVKESMQDILYLHFLANLPFSEPQYQAHHIPLLDMVVKEEVYGEEWIYNYHDPLFTAAMAWNRHTEAY